MRPSSSRIAAQQLRASDAERDEAIGELRDRFAEGRLSQETFLYRMDAALRAKDHAELSDLFIDLPSGHASPAADRVSGAGRMVRASIARLRRLGRTGRVGRWPAGPGPSAAPASGPDSGRVLPFRPGPVGDPGFGHGRLAAMPALPQLLCLPRQEDGRFTIGRAPSCDFTVADLSVSRWHARLHKEEQSWMLSDLGSTNGTRLNGWRVTKGVQVRPGDQVSFGTVTYVITDGPAA